MKALGAAAAIVSAFALGAGTASAAPLPIGTGPAQPLCASQGGEFVPPDESLVSYSCLVSLETVRSGQIAAAKRVCENVYGATFHSFRFSYLCQDFS